MDEIMRHPFFLRHDPANDEHPVPIIEAPNMHELSRSLKSSELIDPDILNNLCALWKDSRRERIVEALLGTE